MGLEKRLCGKIRWSGEEGTERRKSCCLFFLSSIWGTESELRPDRELNRNLDVENKCGVV